MTDGIANASISCSANARRFWRIVRAGGRLIGSLSLVIIGAFVGYYGFIVLELAQASADTGFSLVQIGGFTLHGWQNYALAALLLLVAIGSGVVGFSFYPKRKDQVHLRR